MYRRKSGASVHSSTRTIEEIRSLFDDRSYEYRYEGARIPLPSINVLPQPRKTFENIEELSLDIAKKGLLNPPTVARFTYESCERYLKAINILWDAEFTIENLHLREERDKEVFYILLAGERRLRACHLLFDKGCSECVEANGPQGQGVCFRRHFGSDVIDVRLCVDIPPVAGLFLQLSENTHMAVPPHEEAHAYAELFKLLREVDPDFSLARFARQVGRSPETIRNALRFCDLPRKIQGAVEDGSVHYGIAVEVARLHKAGFREEELHWWFHRAIAGRQKIPEFRESVTQCLREREAGQLSLLEMMSEEEMKRLRRAHIRRVVETNSVQALWAFIYYAERVFSLFERGELGKRDSPFSEGSPVRIFRELLRKQRRLLPHLRSFIPRREYERARQILERGERLAREIVRQEHESSVDDPKG